jgi:outer membrane receptor for ferrienterochelin and colicins
LSTTIPQTFTEMGTTVKYMFCLSLIVFYKGYSFSQPDSIDIYDYDFDQLSRLEITTASKAPQKITEVPSTIFIITATEIRERGYFTLDEALSDLAGFQFRNILGINSYIFQRGIPNQNNLILLLIDGIQVNELNSGGFYGGGQYNLSNIERIEVLYGPASVAYGTNAVSGIINIITKSATEKQTEINTLAGSFNTINTDISYCHANDKKNFGIRISGMCKKSDKADLKEQEGDNNWTALMDNFENDYSFDIKIQAKNFILGTNYLQKLSSAATYIKSTGTIYKDHGSLWNIRFINNYIKYSKNIAGNLKISSTLYNRNATVLNNSVLYVVDTAQIGYYRPNNLTGFENIINYNINRTFSITSGITLEYEQLAEKYSITYSSSPELNPPAPPKPAMKNNYLASLFIEPQLTLLKSLYLSGGVRFDKSSIYDQVITPRAGLSYSYAKQIIRFSYAEAFRAPKPWDYTDGLGNSSLLPEKMKSIEAAVTLSVSDNYKVDLIGYKNKLQNAIIRQDTEEGYRWINEGTINTEGFDICFRYISLKIKSSINYTYNKSYNGQNVLVPEISKDIANASITYLFINNVKINIRASYLGKRENPKVIAATNSYYIDPCLIFHGALSFIDYKGFNIQFIVKNIFNKEYYHTSNREPDRYRQPQRTIMLSVGYSLKN